MIVDDNQVETLRDITEKNIRELETELASWYN